MSRQNRDMAQSFHEPLLPFAPPRGDEDEAAPAALAGRLPSYIADHRQRLRDRFMQGGGPAMPDYELLELVLFRAIPRHDVKPLARLLLDTFGDFNRVITATPARLAMVKGVGDAVVLGTPITVRAFVNLGELTPDDVVVETVYGRVDADDRITQPQHAAMEPVASYDANRWEYRLVVTLDKNGPFGYTVRVLPRHQGLASAQELGLQTVPADVTPVVDGATR